ncbi:hypothetical protein Cni_G05327 [Canna indica]|uniref:Uncharacterized protein n=1 Tax=Canna indica TaxID=4628 RepID=A0AAQ3JYX7_9LILI|nr:hypothetical protein Cni_G05327 [Canna indica]
MGICTSVPKGPESETRDRLGLAFKARRRFVASPPKEKASNGENHVSGFDFNSPGFGSKSEVFFDSQAWLDSDNESDFYSVKGDFTPSRGSTPIHPLSAPLSPNLDNQFFFHKSPDFISELSPTGRKKLSELLLETSESEELEFPNAAEKEGDTNAKSDIYKANTDQPPKSLNGTPYRSGATSVCSREATPSRNLNSGKEKTWKTGHCCLPRLHNFGFDEEHKTSPELCAV